MEIPLHISSNLRSDFDLRAYQHAAISAYMDWMSDQVPHTHGLFHMATGSGKTLVMAACILDLYHRGYRKFIFFVSSNAILQKTILNFTDTQSSKYLFNSLIRMDGQNRKVRSVSNWDLENDQDINIVFTTIQKLHIDLQQPQENGISIEDFRNQEVVFLSDESHHINASTKKNNSKLASWENTINQARSVCRRSLLLEYTATMPLQNEAIAKKYQDKVIFNYPLAAFRHSGYSKHIVTKYTEQTKNDRILTALLTSEYRRLLFAKYDIEAKPVVLIKSSTIGNSAANRSIAEELIVEIDKRLLEKVILDAKLNHILELISLEDLASSISHQFSNEKAISIDTKNDSEQHQILINSLEDQDNPIRIIYAVDKLNEGWDVLNLFDIVRLDATSKKATKKTSIAEAQLIGRGARYYPYTYKNKESHKRKWDLEQHELSICEELHYYASYTPDYVQTMNSTLLELDIIDEKRVSYDNENIFLEKKLPLLKEIIVGEGKYSIAMTSFKFHVFRKAIQHNSFFRYSNLKLYLSELKSVNDIYTELYFKSETPIKSILSSTEELNRLNSILKCVQKTLTVSKIK